MLVILPVDVDMTIVASVITPETTAREEARTVMGEPVKLVEGDKEAGVLDWLLKKEEEEEEESAGV